MLLGTRRHVERPLRLRRRRIDLRSVVASLLLVGLMTASTVVSADVLRQLPDIWQTIKARPSADLTPSVSGSSIGEPTLTFPTIDSDPADVSSNATNPREPSFTVSTETNQPTTIGYADNWLQATDKDDQPETVRRTHQVAVGPTGNLEGRIVTYAPDGADSTSLGNARVFITHQGTLAATTLTDADGRFTVAGLTTGTHALIVAGSDSLLAYGFHVLQSDEPIDANDQPTNFNFESAAITGDNVPAALRRVPTRPPNPSPGTIEVEPHEALIPAGVRAIRQTGIPGTSLRTHRVWQLADGRVIGRVRQLHPQTGRPLLPPTTEVALMQAGDVIATARTDQRGNFAVHDVEPGVYALVAATIEEPTDDERIADRDETTQPVSLKQERADRAGFATFAVEVISPLSLIGAVGNDQHDLQADLNKPLALDFALMDAADLWGFAGLYSSASQRLSKGSAARSTIPPSGTKTATSSARPAGQRPTTAINNPPGGGGGGNVSFPFLPPDNNQGTMSPRAI